MTGTGLCYNEKVQITLADAEAELDGLPLVPASAGTIQDMKALRDRCLAAGIPALVGCDRPGKT